VARGADGRRRAAPWLGLGLLLVALLLDRVGVVPGLGSFEQDLRSVPSRPLEGAASESRADGGGALTPDLARVERAFRERRSGFMVTLEARVLRTLSDDADGSRHQRFVVELPGGQTLLVAHNIDLAARVPVERGDAVRIRGQYEWNERGGVLHWTHHDPAGRRTGGWIEHAGRRIE
jgi:hypothetical protein